MNKPDVDKPDMNKPDVDKTEMNKPEIDEANKPEMNKQVHDYLTISLSSSVSNRITYRESPSQHSHCPFG